MGGSDAGSMLSQGQRKWRVGKAGKSSASVQSSNYIAMRDAMTQQGAKQDVRFVLQKALHEMS